MGIPSVPYFFLHIILDMELLVSYIAFNQQPNNRNMNYYCKFCKQPFDQTVWIDEGIGHYEYWGDVGYHHDMHEVSDCCKEDYWIDSDEDYLFDRDDKIILKAEL